MKKPVLFFISNLRKAPMTLASLVTVIGCSSAQLRIESKPQGAEVVVADKILGKTPLELSEKQNPEIFENAVTQVEVRLNGYEPYRLIVRHEGVQTFDLTMKPFSEGYFTTAVVPRFPTETNLFVREILTIQAQVIARDFEKAQASLDAFMKKYPNVAAAYALQANIEMSKDHPDLAQRNLQRAMTLDPADPLVRRLLESFKKGER